jgi:flagellar hook protein FlgE
MLDSIHIGMSGLTGYSQGLRVIANNTANLNTPGFKGSSIQFADLFASRDPAGGAGGLMRVGYGLNATGTALNFKQGEMRQTGNAMDLAVGGQGLFTLRDEQGLLHYTRAGQFQFDEAGVLVNRSDGRKVMGRQADGSMGEISVAGLRTMSGQASSLLKFGGNLSTAQPVFTLNAVKVLDAAGTQHELTLKFTNTDATQPGSWSVEVMQGATAVGSGQIVFLGTRPVPGSDKVEVSFQPPGGSAQSIVLDFSGDVSSFGTGDLSTLAVVSQDGYAPGTLTDTTFDLHGQLVVNYSNGKTARGATLLLGRFESLDAVVQAGANQFDAAQGMAWRMGIGGEDGFGTVRTGVLEISNVDLSQEFSELVIMQRGYQASSQVVGTANEMLQQLFGLRGK